jgi:hypothetical protein
MRLLRDDDFWLLSTEPRKVGDALSYVISDPRGSDVVARVEFPKVPAYTLLIARDGGELDVLGLAWAGASVRFAFARDGVKSTSKDDRLAMLLSGERLPPGTPVFLSKPMPVNEKGKPVRHPELPELSEPSDKNFVIEDGKGTTHLKIYKMTDRFFGVQAPVDFPATVVFGFAIAILLK